MTINHVNLPPNSVTEIYLDNNELYRLVRGILHIQMPTNAQGSVSNRDNLIHEITNFMPEHTNTFRLFRKETS